MRIAFVLALSAFAAPSIGAIQQPDAVPPTVTTIGSSLIPEDLSRQPFIFADRPTVTKWSADGDTLLTGDLRYQYEAQLEAPFAVKTGHALMNFAAGERFYGIPFPRPPGAWFGTGLHGIVYCSPSTSNGKSTASCLLIFEKQPVSATKIDREPYLADRLAVNFNSSGKGPLRLVVGREPTSSGTTIRVRLLQWSNSKLQFISEAVKDGAVVSAIRSSVPLREGTATITIGRGVLVFEGSGQSKRVTVVSPPAVGDSILPHLMC